jgi:hypothetical protein
MVNCDRCDALDYMSFMTELPIANGPDDYEMKSYCTECAPYVDREPDIDGDEYARYAEEEFNRNECYYTGPCCPGEPTGKWSAEHGYPDPEVKGVDDGCNV